MTVAEKGLPVAFQEALSRWEKWLSSDSVSALPLVSLEESAARFRKSPATRDSSASTIRSRRAVAEGDRQENFPHPACWP